MGITVLLAGLSPVFNLRCFADSITQNQRNLPNTQEKAAPQGDRKQYTGVETPLGLFCASAFLISLESCGNWKHASLPIDTHKERLRHKVKMGQPLLSLKTSWSGLGKLMPGHRSCAGHMDLVSIQIPETQFLVLSDLCCVKDNHLTALMSGYNCSKDRLKNSVRNIKDPMSWEWNLEHCNGFVQDHDQYLVIEQRGNYFIYAQVNRREVINQSFTLMLFKEPNIMLNKVVGPQGGDDKGTINFGRPFFLQRGDKLYCKANLDLDEILAGNQSYWGLYKI
ncbi:tumor necrosis factor ligand superfamily member 18-like protein [Limosa lapponica baueri]|uniref:Tumor necrosis factor ligand superfamily member 18-like protein n=1 Tax=Limosa lapponica baueri TaxID=1758121 RepID=A0A2I0UIA6_LIMLA|nr:tumor necrosis factor ligand superfamily member 18-like protein [Limosa lapponica baueri]